MIRTVGVALLLLFDFSLYGQNQQNPFDLKYRPANPRSTSKSVPLPPIRDTTIKSTTVSTPKPEEKVPKPDTSPSLFIDGTVKSPLDTNPFELSEEGLTDSNSIAIGEESIEENEAIDATQPVAVKKRTSKGIQIFFLLLSLLFLIFIVNVERSFVKDLWRVISNENYSSLHLRNQRNTMRQILLMMGYLVFVMQAGIFFYHALILFNYQGILLDNVWTCMSLILMVYLVRHSVIRYLRWLFNNEKEMTLFSFDISIFNIMVGLVLLPINVLLNFGPESLTKPLIIIGLIVAIIAYLMRQLRWMLTARQLITNSLFLFFVYLCAVEILPLWAITKFFW